MAGRCGIDVGDVPAGQLREFGQRAHAPDVSLARTARSGSGVPQYRSRDRAQSTLLASHSPIRPSRMCSGCQPMVWFWATSSALRSEVRTYQLGLPQ